MKKSDFRIALRGMAEKLDLQWAYAQRIAAEQQAAGTLAYDDNGEPEKNGVIDHQNDASTYPIAYEMPIMKPVINVPITFAL